MATCYSGIYGRNIQPMRTLAVCKRLIMRYTAIMVKNPDDVPSKSLLTATPSEGLTSQEAAIRLARDG